MNAINWKKMQHLVPAIVQDSETGQVLMQGFMNEEAFKFTLESKKLTFFSRSKQRLWTKGETSGHGLSLVSWGVDCDGDALLFIARPVGPTCHTGSTSCWGDLGYQHPLQFLQQLQGIIAERRSTQSESSYTAKLFGKGLAKIAQKVGEEGVETALAAVSSTDEDLIGEAADLLFHLSVLLQARGLSLSNVNDKLASRHKP